MRHPLLLAGAVLTLAACAAPLLAKGDSDWNSDQVDQVWAERALAHPELDDGWSQSCHSHWDDGRIAHCEVREFTYPRDHKPIAIDGGTHGGMTVMGWDRDGVRVLYRVLTRARTEERARALAADIQLERTNGWLRAKGPAESRSEWWSVEIKAWAPHGSDLALTVQNGPLAVRDVHGRMDLNAVNGPVSLVDLGGAVEAHVENGPLHVALAGPRWNGAGLDAEAQNGPLNLVLPADYSARIVTGTVHGPRQFDYAIEANRRDAWISTTLGKGGPPVKVVTYNGPFRIAER